jgi:dCTP deaminase
MPIDVFSIILGKSTYARCGIVTNFTPMEACYSDDTEIMTPERWKEIQDVQIGELVMTRNPVTGMAEWQEVEEFHEYEGHELIHFNSRSIDLIVTKNHNVLVYNRFRDSLGWHLTTAWNIYRKHNYQMSREVNWKGSDLEIVKLGNREFDVKDFAYFLGIYLGDGWTVTDIEKGNYVIRLGAIKDRKIKTHSQAIKAMGFNPLINEGHSVQFQCKAIHDYLKPIGKSLNKFIPIEFKNMTPDRLEFLIKGMIVSDGNAQTQTYYTSSKRLADDFQEIVFKIGKSAIVREFVSEPTNLIPHTNGKRYAVRICNKRIHKVNPQAQDLVRYRGMVYCIGVPNHTVFVRRNGKPVWSGNSWEGHLTIEISNTTPLPALIYANEGIAQAMFFESAPARVGYGDRDGGGKYQGQKGITMARVQPEYKDGKIA